MEDKKKKAGTTGGDPAHSYKPKEVTPSEQALEAAKQAAEAAEQFANATKRAANAARAAADAAQKLANPGKGGD